MTTPTVRRLQLGHELRRIREEVGHTSAQAARVLGCNVTKISRLELGQSGIAIGDLKMLLESYGDDPEHVVWMMDLARNNRDRGRWSGYRATVPEWFRVYVDLEQDAEDIRATQTEVVHGLLQTEAYMRALYGGVGDASRPTDVDSAVQTRKDRQEMFTRSDGPTVSIVLSESSVRRIVGGYAVMAEQLDHLLDMASHPRLRLQLQPFDGGDAGGAAHSFSLLRVGSAGSSPPLVFAYYELFVDALYADDNALIRRFEELWGQRQSAALSPRDTVSRLASLAGDYR